MTTRQRITGLLNNNVFWLCLITLFAHGFILLMDGTYWDEHLLFDHVAAKNSKEFFSFINELGYIFSGPAYLHLGIKYAFGKYFIFGHRLLAFICVLFSGLIFYKILEKVKVFDNPSNFSAAAFFIVYPVVKIYFNGAILLYILCLFLFLAAVYASISKVFTEETAYSRERIAWRVFSLILFFASFYTNSLLAFYLGFLCLIWKGNLKRFVINNLDYILLPFIFFFIKTVFFKAHGYYEGYHKLFSYSLQETMLSLMYGVFYSIKPFLRLIKMPYVLSSMLLGISISFIIVANFLKNSRNTKEYNTLCFGWFLLALAIMPYSLLSLIPDEFYNSRHLLLVSIPISLITVSIVKMVSRVFSLHRLVTGAFYGLLIFVFAIINITNYANWQFRWIKDLSLMAQLEKMPQLKNTYTFYIKNNTYTDYEFGIYQYRFYEWASIFKKAWGDERHIGYDVLNFSRPLPKASSKYFTQRYNLSDYNPDGSAVGLVLSYPNRVNNFSCLSKLNRIAQYYYYKWHDKKGYARFLNGFIGLKIVKEV